jgi:hypothetical protein
MEEWTPASNDIKGTDFMFIGRFERYAMRRSFSTDNVLVVMSQLGFWPRCGLGLGLGAFTLLLGCFAHRWTISHDSITYSSTFPRTLRTVRLSDLSDLVVHFAPASADSEASDATLPFSVQLRTKDGDEHLLGKFRFAQREAFDEFLITLHAVLPLPLDDPEGLFPAVEEPSAEVLVWHALIYMSS